MTDQKQILKALSKPLPIEDVDFRIQSINRGGYAVVVPYKSARVDMARLDEVCGTNWTNDYKFINGSLFCGIGIKFDEWVWRWDVGTESREEKTKGQSSDAFKRAGFRWGIGRELYSYPKITVKLFNNEFQVEGNKVKQTWELKFKDWQWRLDRDHLGNITILRALDFENNKKRFEWPKKTT